MDALSMLLGLVMGLVLLPSIIGVIVLCKKFGITVSLEPLKRLLNKFRKKD
jgi:hypothetical protein